MKHLLNGRQGESISVTDRGIAYGDGLFETIAVIQQEMPLWQYHIERLQAGCQLLKIPWSVEDASNLKKECFEVLQLNAAVHGIIKIIVTRGEGGRGYNPQRSKTPSRIVSYFKVASVPRANYRDGVVVKLCRTPLGCNARLAGLKHLNRLEQVLATDEWQGSLYSEGLMRDGSGAVIEATKSNLFLVKDGKLITPSLTECGVKGVMRRYILEHAPRLGIKTSEQTVSLDHLALGQEVFICNSVVGIWPVIALQGEQLPHTVKWQKGRVTEELQRMIQSNLGLPLVDAGIDRSDENHQ